MRFRRRLPHLQHDPVFVFHHIPKTGGVSVRNALADWFYPIGDYRFRVDKTDFWSPRITPNPVDLSTLKPRDCLTGHWEEPGFHLHERYPEILLSSRFRLFTFVRDPLQIQLSLYSWEQKRGKVLGAHDMEQELLARPNFIAHRIPCPSVEAVEETMRRYEFVGLTDRLQLSFNRLAERFGLPYVPLPHRNRSRSSSQLPAFSDGFLDAFREANAIDYAIYRRARELLGFSPSQSSEPSRTEYSSVELE